jgi:hypothetical protein
VNGQLSPLSRAVLRAQTALAVQTPETLDSTALRDLILEAEGLSNRLSESYLR